MYELSWILRSKPDWRRKAADPEIRGKWRQEALDQIAAASEPDVPLEENLMTEKMVRPVQARNRPRLELEIL